MTNVKEIREYLKRTERLLQIWDTKVDKRKVYLNTVLTSDSGLRLPIWGQAPFTPKDVEACGAVGCLAGWAFVYAQIHKKTEQRDPLRAAAYYYGVEAYPWSGGQGEHLFYGKTTKTTHWQEARTRLVSRIRQLKRMIQDSQ